jgi:hypothetical protein
MKDLPSYLKVYTGVKIIGFHGHARSGKDSAAKYLHKTRSNTYTDAFAAPLKESCAAMFGVHRDFFFDDALKDIALPDWGVTPRMIAQFVGTELVREHLYKLVDSDGVACSNHWIRVLANQLNGVYDADDVICITDVRFQNEYDWVLANNGIIIHLTRPGADGNIGISGHASEQSLVIPFDSKEKHFHVDNSGTLDDLYAKVDTIVNEAGIYPFHSTEQF